MICAAAEPSCFLAGASHRSSRASHTAGMLNWPASHSPRATPASRRARRGLPVRAATPAKPAMTSGTTQRSPSSRHVGRASSNAPRAPRMSPRSRRDVAEHLQRARAHRPEAGRPAQLDRPSVPGAGLLEPAGEMRRQTRVQQRGRERGRIVQPFQQLQGAVDMRSCLGRAFARDQAAAQVDQGRRLAAPVAQLLAQPDALAEQITGIDW